MKLAEALILRADLDRSIRDLQQRLMNNVLVQEGTEPAEDPKELLKDLHRKLNEHETLVTNINITNLSTKVQNGMTLTSAIARRDKLQRLHGIMDGISNQANNTVDRYSKTEILNVATVNVSELRKKMDRLAKEKREIDVEIQAANWTNDLIE